MERVARSRAMCIISSELLVSGFGFKVRKGMRD